LVDTSKLKRLGLGIVNEEKIMDNMEPVKPPYTALAFGIATFFIQINSFSSTSSNGVMTSCSYIDFFALIAGAILVLIGLGRVFKAKGEPAVMLVSLAVAGLGALHIARGFGLIMSPCA